MRSSWLAVCGLILAYLLGIWHLAVDTSLNIAVCIKQVPSTETRITVSPQTNFVDLKNVEWVISPYDEYALEEALRIREKFTGTVTAFSFGPERVKNALKTALATGADNAVWISDEGLAAKDPFVTARILAAALKQNTQKDRGRRRPPAQRSEPFCNAISSEARSL